MEEKKAKKSLSSQSRSARSFTKPSWLLLTIADLDERVKMVDSKTTIDGESSSDTFGGRAESYYRKRPQLLSLLQDLYNSYLSLADRYCRTLTKHHNFPLLSPPSLSDSDRDSAAESDAESSLSYQPPQLYGPTLPGVNGDIIVTELVMKTVNYEILVDQISSYKLSQGDSCRKIELQRSLLEVLESERLILLNENARLGYRVAALVDENRGLSSENVFLKRKAGELARCVLKMREDQRVQMMNRKIEDLQGQICKLAKSNKEYHVQLFEGNGEMKKSKNENGGGVTLEDCFHGDEESVSDFVIKGSRRGIYGGSGGGVGRRFNLWQRVKNFDVVLCGSSGSDSDSTA